MTFRKFQKSSKDDNVMLRASKVPKDRSNSQIFEI